MRKRFDVNNTIALKQPKIFQILLSESQIYYLANFSDYPGDFRLQSGDSEMVQNLDSPRLSVRVDSPVNYPFIIPLYILT